MRVRLMNQGYARSTEFPMTVFEMQDALDKLKYPVGNRNVTFRIYEFRNMDLPYELCGRSFSADIYKLNLFAERIEKLENMEMTAFKSLLKVNPDSSFDDMLLMTYGLDSVPVFPCKDLHELGEMAIENDMLCELEDCSNEMLELLDSEHIGQIMCERDGGVFVDGYYCVPSCYERPDMDIEIGEPDKCFFRLLIAPDFEKTEQSQWVTLPCDEEMVSRMRGMVCREMQSSLPGITRKSFGKILKIGELNQLAVRLSALSHNDFVKLKAVMESERIHDISDTLDCIDRLNEYEFDESVQDESEFGRTYLANNFPADFDNSVLDGMDLYDFSEKILERTGSKITSYGAVSGRGQELYSAITVQPEQQLTEDISGEFSGEEPEEDEYEDLEIGGMSL